MSKNKKLAITLVALFIVAAIVIGAVVGVLTSNKTNFPNNSSNSSNNSSDNNNNSNNQFQNNPSNNDNNSNNNHSQNSSNNNNNNENNNNQSQDPGQEAPITSPVEKISEAEYKAMFEEKIEDIFNEQLANKDWKKVSNIDVKAYNNVDGSVYFSCEQNSRIAFITAQLSGLAGSNSYKEINEKISSCKISVTGNITGVSVQEQSLANEIAAFALEQQEVKDYISTNKIDPTELNVLNATQFANKGGYLTTELTICLPNSIFTLSLAGRTGICSTQEEYLSKMRNGYLERVGIVETIDFEELKVEDKASVACVYEIRFPDGFEGGYNLFNQKYSTSNGD